MNVAELLSDINAGGILAFIVIVLSLVELVPVKISPLAIIGKRLNKETLDKVGEIEKKLDNHIAQSLRTTILNFKDDVVNKQDKTKEQWEEIVDAISDYEQHCQDNKVKNEKCKQAIQFILNTYQFKLQHNQF